MKKVSEYVKYIRIIMRSRCYVILSSWCDLFICWCGSGKCLTKENGWWINLSAVEMLLINEFKNPSYPDMSLNEYSICSDRLYGEQILLLCWCVFVVHLWSCASVACVPTCTLLSIDNAKSLYENELIVKYKLWLVCVCIYILYIEGSAGNTKISTP